MNESSSILVSEIADLRQHLAAAVQEVSDTHYACDEKLLASRSVCSDWVDKYRKAMAERDIAASKLKDAEERADAWKDQLSVMDRISDGNRLDFDKVRDRAEKAEARERSEIEMRKSADNQTRFAEEQARVAEAKVRDAQVRADAILAVVDAARQWCKAIEDGREKWCPEPIQLAGKKIFDALAKLDCGGK